MLTRSTGAERGLFLLCSKQRLDRRGTMYLGAGLQEGDGGWRRHGSKAGEARRRTDPGSGGTGVHGGCYSCVQTQRALER